MQIKSTKGNKPKTNSKNTPYQEMLLETKKKILEFSLICEANVVSLIYEKPSLIYDVSLQLEDFNSNIWKVYYAIAEGVLVQERKETLDEITVGLYLEKHDKLKEKYEQYKGYNTIEQAKEYINVENFNSYCIELKKWNVVKELCDRGFPVFEHLSKFVDMNVEDIYSYYDVQLNHLFINSDMQVKTFDISSNIDELIDDLNAGANVGFPLNGSTLLNKEISGVNRGNIYLCGANSGLGKTSVAVHFLLPSALEYNERICMIINEEDEKKIQKEMLIYVINNIFKQEFPKYKLRDGKFSNEELELLRQAGNYLKEKKEQKLITIIPLESYSTEKVIKIIKKYSSQCKLFIIDTLKPSSNSKSDMVWLEMQREMVELYNLVKPSNKNLALWCNYQLGKNATRIKYLNNDLIGISKNIVDVASVNIMFRRVREDEFEGGKNEIQGFKLVGKSHTKVPFKLTDKTKNYVVIFITKNRFGSTNQFQIIAEHNLSVNYFKELGICYLAEDTF
jgi:replicative DNA helicase